MLRCKLSLKEKNMVKDLYDCTGGKQLNPISPGDFLYASDISSCNKRLTFLKNSNCFVSYFI